MATMVTDPALEARLIEERRRSGADRFDEVWDGVYTMSPLPDIEHQVIVGAFTTVLQIVVGHEGLGMVLPGTNISDREDDWQRNYRCPDLAVFLNGTHAEHRGTHWLGGPDFAVEIMSAGDRSREKRPFYAKVGTRELLIVDREPWGLELYRLEAGALVSAGVCTLEERVELASAVVPLRITLAEGAKRPVIVVSHPESGRHWSL